MFLLSFPWPRFFKNFLLKLAQNNAKKKAQKIWKTMLALSPQMGVFRKLHARVGGVVGEESVGKLQEINSVENPRV